MNTRVYSLGPVLTGPPGVPALPDFGMEKTWVALAGGGPPNPACGGGGIGVLLTSGPVGFGGPPGDPNICVNSPGAPSGFVGVGFAGNENGVEAGAPGVDGEGPPELNIRVNSPGCPPPPLNGGVVGKLGVGLPPTGELKRLAKSEFSPGGMLDAVGDEGVLVGGELKSIVK